MVIKKCGKLTTISFFLQTIIKIISLKISTNYWGSVGNFSNREELIAGEKIVALTKKKFPYIRVSFGITSSS